MDACGMVARCREGQRDGEGDEGVTLPPPAPSDYPASIEDVPVSDLGVEWTHRGEDVA